MHVKDAIGTEQKVTL